MWQKIKIKKQKLTNKLKRNRWNEVNDLDQDIRLLLQLYFGISS